MCVRVIGIDFKGSTACEIGYQRIKDVAINGGGLLDVDFSAVDPWLLDLQLDQETEDGVRLLLKPLGSGTPAYMARLKNGVIIASQEVDEFDLKSQADKFIGVVDEFEDGSMLLRTNLTMFPKVDGLEVRLHIFKAGVTFDDSTIDLTIDTTNFTADEETMLYLHPYSIIIPPNYKGGPCHTIAVFQDGVQVGK